MVDIVGVTNVFEMQGSLVQIQSSLPQIKAQKQDVMLARWHPDFFVLVSWYPNSDHKEAVRDLPPARLWKGKPAPAPKVKRIKYGVPGILPEIRNSLTAFWGYLCTTVDSFLSLSPQD